MPTDILSSLALDLIIKNRPPSESELGSARQILLHLQHEIADISAQIVEEKEERWELESSRRLLKCKEAVLKCVVAPIRRVPQDVICLIFDYCLCEYCALEDDLGDFLPSSVSDRPASDHSLPLLSARQLPLRLTHVSRAFRTIVLAMPTLWSIAEFKIQLPTLPDYCTSDYYKAMGISRRNQISGMEEWLRRSGSLPLNVDVHFISRFKYNHQDEEFLRLYNDMINIIFSCHSRWRDIRFSFDDIPPEKLISELSSLSPKDLPFLRTLKFHSYRYNMSTRYVKCMPMFSCSSLKTLTGVALDGLQIDKDTLSSLTLLHASIQSYTLTVARTLCQCTSLIELRLVNHSAYTDNITVPKYWIELPCLQKLYVLDRTSTRGEDEQSSMTPIKYMITPKLHTLYYAAPWSHFIILPDIFTRPHNITTLGLSVKLSCALFIEILRYCPQIKRLDGLPSFSDKGPDLAVAYDKLLIRLVDADDTGDKICPKLEDFNAGHLNPLRIVNVNTLYSIITRKGSDPSANLAPWRKLRARIRCRRKDEKAVRTLLSKCNRNIFGLVFFGVFDDDDEA